MRYLVVRPILCLLWTLVALPAAAGVPLSQTCQESGDTDALGFEEIFHQTTPYPTNILEIGTADQIVAALQSFCALTRNESCLAQAPWILMNASRPEIHEAAFEIQQVLASRFLQLTGFSTATPAAVIAKAAAAPAQYSPATTQTVAAVIAAAKTASSNNNIGHQLPKDEKYTDLVCAAFLDPLCPSTLSDLTSLADVGTVTQSIDGKETTDLTATGAIQTLFSDPSYAQGLAIAAQRILQRLDDAQKGILWSGHFLDDLEEGYHEAGYSPSEAEDRAFTFLAYYGARGASIEFTSPLATAENYPVFVASYLITAALGALDDYYPHYSLPSSVSTSCAYGRPYHFWLAAYLARTLVQRGHDRVSSVIAAHISGVGYEALADTVTRVPYDSITFPAHSEMNESIRINVAFDDAGAVFGAELNEGSAPPAVNLDARIEALLGAGFDLPPLSAAAAKDLYTNHLLEYAVRWDLIFSPNTGFLGLEAQAL